jgi:predicted dehydrogenase
VSPVRTPSLIVGAGLMGRHHARSAVTAGAAIVGIVDRDFEAAKSLARQWHGATATTELKEALNSRGAAVVHICTPAASHAEIARIASDAGCHALIEKPLGETVQDAQQIHEHFLRSQRLACPTHQYAFQRAVIAASAGLQHLGVLRHIAFEICSAGAAAGHISRDELIAEILPHPLSILQQLLPSIELPNLDWTCIRATPGEWLVAAPADGVLLTMSLSANGRPTRFLSRITAESGSIEIDHFHDFAIALPGEVSRSRKILAPFVRSGREVTAAAGNLVGRAARGEFAYPGLRRLVGDFYGAVRKPGSPPPISPEQSIAVAAVRDTIIGLASRG